MNDGKNGLMGPMLLAALVFFFFPEKEVDLQGKSPWVGLYRTIWFQFLVPEPGGCVCPVLPSDTQTSFVHKSTVSFNLEQELGKALQSDQCC